MSNSSMVNLPSESEDLKQEETEKYKNLQHRMYKSEYPKENDVVFVSYNLFTLSIYINFVQL